METDFDSMFLTIREICNEFFAIGYTVLQYQGNDIGVFTDIVKKALLQLRGSDLIEREEYEALMEELNGLPMLDSSLQIWKALQQKAKGTGDAIGDLEVDLDEEEFPDLDPDDLPQDMEVDE